MFYQVLRKYYENLRLENFFERKFEKNTTKAIAGNKIKKGRLNSGMDLSGDMSCPHLLGSGIKGYFSNLTSVGQPK